MDLSNLVFKTETSELLQATEAIGALIQEMNKATASAGQMARTQAQTEAVLARAAKNYAEARKQNAEATAKELQTANATEQAEQKREKALKKTTEAVDENTSATSKHTSVLQRQSDILEFQAQGWSKSQAGILATARAAKTAAEDMQKLMEVLDTQRKLMGTDPFDKSMSGLKSLQNQYNELRESIRQYNTGSDLTSKQTKELARDKQRIIEQLKLEGASFNDIRSAIRAYNAEYNTLAASYNRLIATENEVIKKRREMVSAANYVTQADEKMKAALDATNSSLNKAATDELVKYETALHKSGLAQDLITKKLETYKGQLTQVQAAEQKRAADHLARSLSPQLTDIGVSLWSGQSPLTVLIQQGGQMMDLFRLSGIEAKDMGKAVKDAFDGMIPSIMAVGKALGSFVLATLQDAGRYMVKTVADFTMLSVVLDKVKLAIFQGDSAYHKYIGTINQIGEAAAKTATVGIAALLTMFVAIGIEYKKIIQTASELSKALATSGGALAMSKDQATAYADSLKGIGVGALKAQEAITEFAKVGKVGATGFDAVVKAAVEMEKTLGVSLEDTAKQYAKLQDTPTKTLTEIAVKTGLVDNSVLDLVRSLEEQGKTAEAAELATLALASANLQMAIEYKDNLTPIEALWIDIKSAIGKVKAEIHDLSTSNAVVATMRTVWETVSVVIAETWFTIKGVGKEIGGIAAQIAAVLRGDFSGAKTIGEQMKIDAASARAEQDALVKSLLDRGKQEGKFFNDRKAEQSAYASWNKENEKALAKSLSKKEQFALREKQLQKDLASNLISEAKYNEAIAGWKRVIFGYEKESKAKTSDSYYQTTLKKFKDGTIEATVANDDLTKSQIELMKVIADPKFLKETKAKQENILATAALAIQSEKLAKAKKEEGEAEEFRLKILGKSEGLGKQYYDSLEKILAFRESGKYTQAQTEELTQALYKATPAWTKYAKDVEEAEKALNKYNEESIKSRADTSGENLNLDLRLSLLGKTVEEQRKLQIEHERSIKLSEVDLDLAKKKREIEASIAKAKKDNLPDDSKEVKGFADAIVQAEQDAAEKRKLINREVAVQYAEDMQKEFDRISGGITDSIVTALFEGGKAGSQSIRNFLVNELKKPVTLVVQAVVNILLGSVIGGIAGGAASGGASSLMSAGASGIGSSLAGNVLGSLGAFGGAVQGFGTAALAATQSMIGMTGTVAQMSTSLAAAGHTAAAGMQSGIAAFQAIPGWGWALAGIGLLAGLMDFGGETRFGGGYQLNGEGKVKYTAGPGGGQIANREQEQVATQTYKSINSILESFGSTLKVIDFYAGLETSSKGKGGTFAGGKLTGGIEFGKAWKAGMYSQDLTAEEAVKQYIGQMKIVTVEALKAATDIPMYVQDALKPVDLKKLTAETADTVLQEINSMFTLFSTVKGAFELLNKPLLDTTTAGFDLAESLVDAFGGMETFKASVTDYFDAFTTDIEKLNYANGQLTKVFEEAGIAVPRNAEQYRNLVESQDLNTEAGRELYAVLMQNAKAYVELLPAIEKSGDFFELYYSDAEKVSYANKNLSESLRAVGLEVPKTQAEYRKLVESQDLTTEAGRKNYAVLLKNAGAFAELTPAAEQANKSIAGVNKLMKSLNISGDFNTKKFSKNITEMFESIGSSAEDYSKSIGDVIQGIVTGKIKAEDAGKELADAAVGGITNAIAQGASQAIAAQFVSTIISPIIANIMAGNAALAGIDMQAGLTNLRSGTEALKIVLNTVGPELQNAFSGLAGAVIEGASSTTRMIARASKFAIGGSEVGSSTTIYSPGGSLVTTGTNQYGGVGDSPFAIGGSAVGSLRNQDTLAISKIAQETLDSNKKVSELLQELLNPKKLYDNRYEELAAKLVEKRNETIAVQGSQGSRGASLITSINKLPEDIENAQKWIIDFEKQLEGWKSEGWDSYEAPEEILRLAKADLKANLDALGALEAELHDWYLAQARVIAVEDIVALTKETTDAKAKIEELERTGGLSDPISTLKESFAKKLKGINDGINAALQKEVNAKSNVLEKLDPKFAQQYEDWLLKSIQPEDYKAFTEIGKEFEKILGFDLFTGLVDLPITSIKQRIEKLKNVIPGLEGEIKTLTDEQQKYITTLEDWYKAQADLLSTEMLVDINNQIKALETEEKGPLSTIKDAIQKYINDFTELGTLTDDIQAQLDKLSDLQLTKAREELYNQLIPADEMKQIKTLKLTEQFTELGKTLPTSADELRKMIDAAREAGNVTLADSLLELIPAFMALQDAANGVNAGVDAANKAFDALQRATEARIKELEKTFTATDLAMKVLEKVVESEKKRLNEELKTAQESVNTLKKIFDTLTNGIKTLRGEVQQTKGLQVQEARRVIDTANLTGVLPDAEALADAVSTLTGSVQQGLYATSYDKSRAFLTLANDLEKLKSTAEPQLTSAEQAVLNLETQIKQLDSILESARKQLDELRGIDASLYGIDESIALVDAALQQLQTAAKAEEEARVQINVLNAQLEVFRLQIDLLNGIDSSVKSVEDAVRELKNAISGTKQNTVPDRSTPYTPPPPQLSDDSNYGNYQNSASLNSSMIGDNLVNLESGMSAAQKKYLDEIVDTWGKNAAFNLASEINYVKGLNDYQALFSAAGLAGIDIYNGTDGSRTIKELEEAFGVKITTTGNPINQFAGGGRYQGGLALVGEQGPELINFSNPGMVYTAAQSSGLMNGSNAELIFEIKALRSEVIMLRAEARATAINTSKSTRILDDVTQGGDSFKTTAV